MRAAHASALLLTAASLAGCARWEPQTAAGPVVLSPACPLQRGPAVSDLGETGLRGVYNFVTQDAPEEDLTALLAAARAHGFEIMLMTVNLNGKDTLFATGPGVLRTQDQVDAEFEVACALGHGKVYLTHVRYNPPDPKAGSLRVR